MIHASNRCRNPLGVAAALALALAPFTGPPSAAAAAQEDAATLNSGLLSGLRLRAIGPAARSGRVADVAVDPTDRAVWYVAVASGNAFKTVNRGTTWIPIFDDYPVYSTSTIVVDPTNPSVLWLGTGENNGQRSAGYGNGVYRSRDAGASFEHLGLDESEHIGKIVLDPRDPNRVFVAAQGPLWRAGGDRGLFRTEDGGGTWERVLHISDDTGISDVLLDPRDPDIVYAAAWQRRRHTGLLVAGGPEGGIHKSEDGGATWRRLTRGFPPPSGMTWAASVLRSRRTTRTSSTRSSRPPTTRAGSTAPPTGARAGKSAATTSAWIRSTTWRSFPIPIGRDASTRWT